MRLQRRMELESKLREDRLAVYNRILEPFMMVFTADEAWRADPRNKGKDKNALVQQKLLSLEYRQDGFRLSLLGSDEVVRAYNDLMQYFFRRGKDAPAPEVSDVRDWMDLMGRLLLEIRRSMGNEATKLDNWDMLEWFLTDARKLRSST